MRSLHLALFACLLTVSACSAVVSPDPARLGGRDAAVPPGVDAAVPPRVDAATPPGVDAALPPVGLGDPNACGPSRTTCSSDRLCVGGSCQCRPPLTDVGGRCIDLQTDPDNCGMPGNRCGGRVCALGSCVNACPDGTRECDNACVNVRTDPLNCGECGRTCRATQACQGGECRDVSVAPGCTSCPCDACRGSTCCTLPVFGVPYCLDAERCP